MGCARSFLDGSSAIRECAGGIQPAHENHCLVSLPMGTAHTKLAHRWPLRLGLSLLCLFSFALAAPAQYIGNHLAVYDEHGILLPWTPWRDAIQREVNWYLKCPVENGYPRFVYMTFMNGNYEPLKKNATFIPPRRMAWGSSPT